MSDRVAVLGATGYLGQTLVSVLLAAGRPVTMVARRQPPLVPPGARFVACDAAGDAAKLARAVQDASQIVNAVTGTPATIVRVADNLAAHLPATGARSKIRLVHISSLAVFGQTKGVFDETAHAIPYRWHRYAAAKLRAETILLANPVAALGCAILRPGCIYGAGAAIWTNRIGRLLLTGRLGALGREGDGRCHVVHVGDLAATVLIALSSGRDVAGLHHIAAPDELTWNAYLRRFAAHLGIAAPPSIGRWQLTAESWLTAPIAQLSTTLGQAAPDIITPAMRRLFRSQAILIRRRSQLLPLTAFRPLEHGLANAAECLLQAAIHARARQYVPGPTLTATS